MARPCQGPRAFPFPGWGNFLYSGGVLVERRRVARTEELLAIKEINGQPGAGNFVLDHSPAGAKLESNLAFIPRDTVSFSYQRPGEERETRRWGRVIWVMPVPDKPGRFFLGVEFFLPVD